MGECENSQVENFVIQLNSTDSMKEKHTFYDETTK